MIRRPPRSTLFPTRRSSDLGVGGTHATRVTLRPATPEDCRQVWRSEEHTSELQSHSDLVCRLLLEKKKSRQDRGQKGRGESPASGRQRRREVSEYRRRTR